MTPEQYDRWKDFASRMARTCFQTNRRPDSRWIAGMVEKWFDRFDEHDVPCVVDWDSSTEYPEGNYYRRREYHASYCDCDGRRQRGKLPEIDCPECHGFGTCHAWVTGYPVCDMVTEFLENQMGYPPRCRACDEYDDDAKCRCEEIELAYREQWDDQWGGPVCCCIRAGLDFASAPSGGVTGFTAGDVRRMYPEGIPDWVFPPNERLRYWMSDKINGTFIELPDEAQLVL